MPPTLGLFAFRLLGACRRGSLLFREMAKDGRALPSDSAPAREDLGWDREDETPSQPPKTPVLK